MQNDTSVPRVIYSLWLQGEAHAPPIVRLNLARWRKLNPTHVVRVLDWADVRELLRGFPVPLDLIPDQALSDIVRAVLLTDKGGVWVDSTLYPSAPLDAWADPSLLRSGFFAFERPAADRLLSSWFLAVESGSRLMRTWTSAVLEYWNHPRLLIADPREGSEAIPEDPIWAISRENPDENTYPYFWFHYLFARTLREDDASAATWRDTPKRSAGPAHVLQNIMRQTPRPSTGEIRQALDGAPVHKLDHRTQYPVDLLTES